MTLEKQIQNLIDKETGIDNYGSLDYQVGVHDGVRLTRKTIINRACMWLEMRFDEYIVRDFRKAMEELC